MAEQRFTAVLEDSGRGGGRRLQIPFDPNTRERRVAKALAMLEGGETLS